MSEAAIDWPAIGPDVAKALLGEPTETTASELKWGGKQARKLDIATGEFFDHESDRGGGVLAMVQMVRDCDKPAALQWLETEGFIDGKTCTEKREAKRTGSAFYDYRGPDGHVAYRVERTGKTPPFLHHGPDGRGGFHCGKGCMEGIARIPYNLDLLVAAPKNRVVFITEGEKDADRLAALDLIATTNSGGAGKWLPEFSRWLEGRRVVVLQDNDDAGAGHVESVIDSLQGVAKVAAPLLLPDLPPKGDVSDWLDAGNDKKELTRLAQAALDAAGPELLETLDWQALAKVEPRPKYFVVPGFVPEGEVTLFTGPGSGGKSLLCQQIATALSEGVRTLGLPLKRAPALYLTCEDSAEQLHWRQDHICRAIGVPIDRLGDRYGAVSLRGQLGNELGVFSGEGLLTPTAAFHRLSHTIAQMRAKLVCLDNVSHLFTGNENDRGEVTRFINLLNRLAGETNAAIVLIAHPNKAGASFSGSTAWQNAVRSQITIDFQRDGEGGVLDPDVRTLKVEKANYSRNGEELTFRWHEWAYVRPDDMPPDTLQTLESVARANTANDAFLACLAIRNAQKRSVSEKYAPNYAPTQFERMPEAKGFSKSALEAAMDRLFRINRIGRGFVYRDTEKGRDVHGIVDLQATPQTVPQTVPQTHPKPSPTTPPKPTDLRPSTHTPLPKGREGGALEGPPPERERMNNSGSDP